MNKPNPTLHKINFRLPMRLIEEVKAQAAEMGISVNAYLLDAVHRQVRRVRRELGESPRAPAAARPLGTAGNKAPAKVGRNDPCPCGSGRKAKHCHPESC